MDDDGRWQDARQVCAEENWVESIAQDQITGLLSMEDAHGSKLMFAQTVIAGNRGVAERGGGIVPSSGALTPYGC